MAALSSRDASGPSPTDRFRLLRELGARPVPTWAALELLPSGRTQLVVVERVARAVAAGAASGSDYTDQEIADWVRDARRVAALEHPNVARVRDVLIRSDDVLVATEFIDGARWSELVARPVPLELILRVFLDVLAGLSALHNLRDAKRQPLKLVHGELTPECVIVGDDGVTRVVGSCRAKSAATPPGRAGAGYLAPEVLLSDDSADARADLFGVGVMLWEALCGAPLFGAKTQPSAIVTRVLGGHVPLATVPAQHPWAAPLVGLVQRALSADPQKRFASASDMSAELRRIAGPRLAAPSRLAAHVRAAFGDKIRARREHLERAEVRPPEVSRIEPQPAPQPDDALAPRDEAAEAPTPVPPKPAPQEAVAVRPAVPPAPRAPVFARRPVPAAPQIRAAAPAPVAPPAPVVAPPVPAEPPDPGEAVVPVPAQDLAPPHAAAGKPPPLPAKAPPPLALRARLPTLTGVAPPAPESPAEAARRPPVVVPSSNPPPPPLVLSSSALAEDHAPVHVPAAPRVPRDLAAAAAALSLSDSHAAATPLPAPASPLPAVGNRGAAAQVGSTPAPRRRVLLLSMFAVPAILTIALIVWLAPRSPASHSPDPSTVAAMPPAPAAPPVVAPAQPAAAAQPPPAEVTAPAAVAPPTPPPPAATQEPAAAQPPATMQQPAVQPDDVPSPHPGPSRGAAPFLAPAVPPARPPPAPARPRRTKPKYEPEGI